MPTELTLLLPHAGLWGGSGFEKCLCSSGTAANTTVGGYLQPGSPNRVMMISLATRLLLQAALILGHLPERCSSSREGSSSKASCNPTLPAWALQPDKEKLNFCSLTSGSDFFPPHWAYCRSMIFKCWHKHKYYSWTVGNRGCSLQQHSSIRYNYVHTYMAPFSWGAAHSCKASQDLVMWISCCCRRQESPNRLNMKPCPMDLLSHMKACLAQPCFSCGHDSSKPFLIP